MKKKARATRMPFIYFDNSGSVHSLSLEAARWLKRHFPGCNPEEQLPGPMWEWVKHQRGNRALKVKPFVWKDHGKFLVATFPTSNPRHGLLLLSQTHRKERTRSTRPSLTDREQEVLEWISKGKTNSDIAIILDISPRTVHKHVERILQKLGVENRGSAAAHALRQPRFKRH